MVVCGTRPRKAVVPCRVPRSAAPLLREFCALLECVYCVCPGLGKALQEALDELKSVAHPLHSPCVGPCAGRLRLEVTAHLRATVLSASCVHVLTHACALPTGLREMLGMRKSR